jgi:hypothetical protein
MNANCPDGDPWDFQRRAAVMLVSGGNGFCSGSMINNSQNDGTPYVLTANHCGSNPTNWVFRFNWQAPGCTNPASSPSFNSLSGAVSRAKRTPSDFHLVEITGGLENGTVPLNYYTYFPGWDNSDVQSAVSQVIGIHHPSGDIKKICRAFDNANNISHNNVGGAAVWFMNSWDDGVTEPGSSGSPLFDQNGRIIGQLYGGAAACNGTNNNGQYDFYGRFGVSWDLGVKGILAPSSCGTEPSTNDGFDPNPASSSVEELTSNLFSVSPNPSSGLFTVQLEELSNDAQITILDMTGRVILTENVVYGISSLLDLSKSANGTYIVRLTSNLGTETKTIVVNK